MFDISYMLQFSYSTVLPWSWSIIWLAFHDSVLIIYCASMLWWSYLTFLTCYNFHIQLLSHGPIFLVLLSTMLLFSHFIFYCSPLLLFKLIQHSYSHIFLFSLQLFYLSHMLMCDQGTSIMFFSSSMQMLSWVTVVIISVLPWFCCLVLIFLNAWLLMFYSYSL